MGDHRGIDRSPPSLADLPDPSADRPLLAGAAVATARALGLPVLAVRAAYVATTFAAGLGLLVYVVVWLLVVRPATVRGEAPAPATRLVVGERRSIGVGLVAAAALALAVQIGWMDASVAVAVSLVAAGVVVSWGGGPQRSDVGRQVLGAGLVIAGLLIVVGGRLSWSLLVDGAVVGAVVLFGAALVLGPWMIRTSNAAIQERRERVRSEEREAVAAHLHDSVLQTLTLIQRRAAEPDADPRVMGALARRQERELRRWLYGHSESWQPGTRLRDALESTAADVEDLHGITVELVVVGDATLDDRSHALVGAAREAMVNAAKFSGCTSVSVYAESGGDSLSVFVRDRGVGFAPHSIPADRQGLRGSIVARMAGVGGSAVVHSSPGNGAEIELTLPITNAATEPNGRTR